MRLLPFILIAFLVQALLSPTGAAQEPEVAGFWYQGQFIGFSPHAVAAEGRTAESPDVTHREPRELSPVRRKQRSRPQVWFEASADVEPIKETVEVVPCSRCESSCGQQTPWSANKGDCRDGCGKCQVWGSASFLLWWTKEMSTPPLVTTSPVGTPRGQAGVLGLPGTRVLFGGGVNGNSRPGGRFTLGYWLIPCQTLGVEATYLTLANESTNFRASNNEFAILARPFTDAQTGTPDARLIVFPDDGVGSGLSGGIAVNTTTRFDSFELLFRRRVYQDWRRRFDVLLGYRYGYMSDDLFIRDSSTSLSGATAGARIDSFDRFDTENHFHGFELGASVQWRQESCWTLELLAKLAVGNTNSAVAINGQTTTTNAAGMTDTFAGGLLALPTNSDRFEQNDFTTTVELGATLRKQLPCGVGITFGYSFIYWSEVARAGDQTDLDVNLSQAQGGALTGPQVPMFAFVTDSFWAQGLHVGLQYNY